MIPIYGGEDFLIQPDILPDHLGSVDIGRVSVLDTGIFTLMGDPGDVVLRRLFLTVEHAGDVSLTLSLFLDGVLVLSANLTASGTGRRTWMIPVARPGPEPARGRAVQFRIQATSPRHRWAISDLDLDFKPGRASRGQA